MYSCLIARSKDALVKIHRVLVEEVCALFECLNGSKAVNRQTQHTLLSDINELGCSIAKNYPKDLEKIRHAENSKSSKETALETVLTKLEDIFCAKNISAN